VNHQISYSGGVSKEDAIIEMIGGMKSKIADLLGGTVLLIIWFNETLIYERGN
jgi:hypothetical protein